MVAQRMVALKMLSLWETQGNDYDRGSSMFLLDAWFARTMFLFMFLGIFLMGIKKAGD
jgi:hypothetical protein